jgi:hypothetical protein
MADLRARWEALANAEDEALAALIAQNEVALASVAEETPLTNMLRSATRLLRAQRVRELATATYIREAGADDAVSRELMQRALDNRRGRERS